MNLSKAMKITCDNGAPVSIIQVLRHYYPQVKWKYERAARLWSASDGSFACWACGMEDGDSPVLYRYFNGKRPVIDVMLDRGRTQP